MNLLGVLALIASLAPLTPRPVTDPAGALRTSLPPGWRLEHKERGLVATSPDRRSSLELVLLPERDHPPTDHELLRLWGVSPGEVATPLPGRLSDGLYLRDAALRRGGRYLRLAGLYAGRRLWLWRMEGPYADRRELSFWGSWGLRASRCLMPTVTARQPLDFGAELSLRLGPGFRLGLPEQWRVMSRVSHDFLAVYQRYGQTVADISVLTAPPAAGLDDRALFLESLLLDVESTIPGFRLLASSPTVLEGLPAQIIEGRYLVDEVPVRWFCAVLFGSRGTYAVTGQCAEENHQPFRALFLSVASSLREGALTPWYEELWDFLINRVTTLLIPLLLAILSGLYFALVGLQRLLTYIGLLRGPRPSSTNPRRR